MQTYPFYKFHGTGNDFVIVDNRDGDFNGDDYDYIRFLCHRRFGIGADGFMLLENSPEYAFNMRYYNSDGNESTMCGNGGRCIVAFAVQSGIVPENKMFDFEAIDGLHQAQYSDSYVKLKMVDVSGIQEFLDGYVLNTGSPHFVRYSKDLDLMDVVESGRNIRNNKFFGKEGANVNFVQQNKVGDISVRTYERGVEDETWSCGTGCVASVLTNYYLYGGPNKCVVKVRGGELTVSFSALGKGSFNNIWLEGPAQFVFKGEILKSHK